jgi:hypothetical protein
VIVRFQGHLLPISRQGRSEKLGCDVDDVDARLTGDRPSGGYERSKDWHWLSKPIFQMIDLKRTRRFGGIAPDPALVACLDLEPEMKEWTAIVYRLAIQVDAYVCIDRDGSHEALRAQASHDGGSSIVALQPTFSNCGHVALLCNCLVDAERQAYPEAGAQRTL